MCPCTQVTSRPENYIVKRLEGYRPFMLRPNELRNIADIRAFIRGSLTLPVLQWELRHVRRRAGKRCADVCMRVWVVGV